VRTGIRAVIDDHVSIRDCSCADNGRWGIFTGFVDDLLIEDNETYGSVIEHGIQVSNSGDRPVIRRNHSHDNNANGISLYRIDGVAGRQGHGGEVLLPLEPRPAAHT
jgi:hypothetical protein